MAFTWISSVVAALGNIALLCTLVQSAPIDLSKVLPGWKRMHPILTVPVHQLPNTELAFNAGAANNAALLKVPMISAGDLKVSSSLTIEITVANDISIGGKPAGDSDIKYGVSDGTRFIGFQTMDKNNYHDHAPCFGTEGISGPTLSSARQEAILPKPSDSFYPGQFVFNLKLNERWGSCYTAHDGGFVRTASYNNRLALSKGLTLEVYKSDKRERVGIKFIKVAITQDDA